MPSGVAVADMMAGAHLVQGVLAALVRRGVTGRGGRVDVSLMESIIELQFEFLTTFLNDGGLSPRRSGHGSAYLSAPYGVYPTLDGHLAIAMNPIGRLGELLGCEALLPFADASTWFTARDEIKDILRDHLAERTTAEWLAILEPADIWCAEVLDWDRLVRHDGFHALQLVQDVVTQGSETVRTTRCPKQIGEIVEKLGRALESVLGIKHHPLFPRHALPSPSPSPRCAR